MDVFQGLTLFEKIEPIHVVDVSFYEDHQTLNISSKNHQLMFSHLEKITYILGITT